MSAFTDILTRTDAILAKYEHYDEAANGVNRSPSRKTRSEDPFSDKYFDIMDRVQELNLKAESLVGEKNRALRAAMNAELRKEKTLLLDEIPALEQLLRASPSKKKPVTQEIEYERRERLAEVIKAVEDVPDGLPGGPSMKPQRLESATNGSASYSGRVVLDINNLSAAVNDPKAYEHTQDTAEFVRDATMAKERQDLALDNIERGISTLKELGAAMGDELERHDVVIDEVGAKMDTVTKELQNNNMKLKGLVTQVRSSRRFFIDLILICVLLGLGLYIFNMVSK